MSDTPSTGSSDADLLKSAAEGCTRIADQIGRVIVGQQVVVRHLLAAVLAQGHTMIVGVPGLAKTLMVKTLSDALGWSFKRIQFTPDMMPADIIGMELLQEDAEGRSWQFTKGPIFANLVLADEINRTPPKTQAALLEAMQEYTVTSMGKSHPIEKPFIVVATQNPIEQEGTYPLPEAQLDRFLVSLRIGYPSRAEEERIVAQTTVPQEASAEAIYTTDQVVAYQQLVRRLPASPHVIAYAVSLARATRPDDEQATEDIRRNVRWGAGPRAAQGMILMAKALAALEGRPAVGADDVRAAASPVLRHRVLPSFNAIGEGIGADTIIDRVLEQTPEPSGSA